LRAKSHFFIYVKISGKSIELSRGRLKNNPKVGAVKQNGKQKNYLSVLKIYLSALKFRQ